ncbi:hypothetical protein NY537_14765 [Curtobacterium flaccumfaciens pv. betae]|uniref:hypothetical protein n=1 Tax=Curtobacterium flaccumfaciens TaxID=2035 RepID=UPI00265A1E71|nr:hypothetical protein [Curtobacterium flaccumfaciens]MCS5514003.1 hypothetical protein [Curtobacterium flaccumfaciens pv. betae]
MATLSKAFEAYLIERLGEVPAGIDAVVSPLSASQRDDFTRAWINASDSQRERPAESWVVRDEDRAAFERFRTGINELVIPLAETENNF